VLLDSPHAGIEYSVDDCISGLEATLPVHSRSNLSQPAAS